MFLSIYIQDEEIENKCISINEKRSRPTSAPLTRSQSAAHIRSSGTNQKSKSKAHRNKRSRARPKSHKTHTLKNEHYSTNSHSKLFETTIAKHYHSTTNLVFAPTTIEAQQKFKRIKAEQYARARQHKPKVNSFTGSYLTATIDNTERSDAADQCIPDGLSRAKWIKNYIKDKKDVASLYSLDEFAQLKLMDLERMNKQKRHILLLPDKTSADELDAMLGPDLHDESGDDAAKSKSSSFSDEHAAQIQHLNLPKHVTDNSLRVALYIDLMRMIADEIPEHSELLLFVSTMLSKYTLDIASSADSVPDEKSMAFARLCKLSTFLDGANHYKHKYKALLREMSAQREQEERVERQSRVVHTLRKVAQDRSAHMKVCMRAWCKWAKIAVFRRSQTQREKRRRLRRWKAAWDQANVWNLQSQIVQLHNELRRSEMYKQLYMKQNDELLAQIGQYKEALVVCVDGANHNEFCEVCFSKWHSNFKGYLRSLKLRNMFINDLL